MLENMHTDLKQVKGLPKERKVILGLLIAILFVVSIIVGAYLSQGKTSLLPTGGTNEQAVVPTTKPSTSLSMTVDNQSLRVGTPSTVSVNLAQLPVSAADIVLTYDPAVLTISNIKNGVVFDRIIRRSIQNGTVTFSAAVSPEKKDQLTEGTVMSFTVAPLKAGSTTIAFDSAKTITAVNGVNTVGQMSDLTLTAAQ